MAAPTKEGSGDSRCHRPPVLWAQRKDKVFLKVALENCHEYKHDIKEQSFHFSGKSGPDKLDHELSLELFAEIDKENVKVRKTDREFNFVLFKKDSPAVWWPRLTKEKLRFIKTDFDKWRDEDESEDESGNDLDFADMMGGMQGMNGRDLGTSPDGEEEDSDDEDLPDLQ